MGTPLPSLHSALQESEEELLKERDCVGHLIPGATRAVCAITEDTMLPGAALGGGDGVGVGVGAPFRAGLHVDTREMARRLQLSVGAGRLASLGTARGQEPAPG